MPSFGASRRGAIAAVLATAAATAVLTPAAAMASSVTVQRTDFNADGTVDAATLVYLAGDGERNDVRVTQAGQTFTVTDPGAVIAADERSNCTVASDRRSASCTNPGRPDVTRMVVAVSDADDAVLNDTSVTGTLDGGSGNDRLTGSDAVPPADEGGFFEDGDRLVGGPGNDTLAGRRGTDFLGERAGDSAPDGDDTLTGGPGQDTLDPGNGNDTVFGEDGDDFITPGPGKDSVDGGAGVDTLDYAARQRSVTVNLAARDGQGEAGENDAQAGIEDVSSGEGNDVLTGNAASNEFFSGAGNDTINAGPGVDFVFAGSGDDTINVKDDGGDRAFCSAGTDAVEADDVDVISECERATVTRATPPTTRVEVPVPVAAPRDATPPQISSPAPARTLRRSRAGRGFTQRVAVNETATVRVQLLGRLGRRARIARAGDVVLSETRALLQPNAPRRFRVRLSRSIRRALPRRGRVSLTVLITAVDAGGNEASRRYRITLR